MEKAFEQDFNNDLKENQVLNIQVEDDSRGFESYDIELGVPQNAN
jgi:hypothetical protein